MNTSSVTRIGLLLCGVLVGCAGKGWQAEAPLYRCEQGIEFRVRFIDNTALLDGSRGTELLFRDAGGVGETQTVYTSAQMRAEFGLGPSGREAVVRYPLLPLVVRCVRD